MRLLDRYVLRHFLLAYAVGFVSLLGLYVVIDLFTRSDEFTEDARGTGEVLANVGVYYLYRLPLFFVRLSGVLALLAATFTVAWLERQNEVMPWLAAGVPLRRLLAPLLGATVLVTGLSVANREWVVPRCSPYLQRGADDPRGRKTCLVHGGYDKNLIHFDGRIACPERQMIQRARVTLPPQVMGGLVNLRVEEMFYRPARGTETSGWYLLGVTPAHVECPHPALNWLGPGRYFVHTDLSFERLTRPPDWFHYEATPQLFRLLGETTALSRRGELLTLLHRRLTSPLAEFVLVLLGVALIAGRPERNLFIKLGTALIAYALFAGAHHICHSLARQADLNPALAAWLPALVFGPLALALLDGVRT